jgi:hypothetical protein
MAHVAGKNSRVGIHDVPQTFARGCWIGGNAASVVGHSPLIVLLSGSSRAQGC